MHLAVPSTQFIIKIFGCYCSGSSHHFLRCPVDILVNLQLARVSSMTFERCFSRTFIWTWSFQSQLYRLVNRLPGLQHLQYFYPSSISKKMVRLIDEYEVQPIYNIYKPESTMSNFEKQQQNTYNTPQQTSEYLKTYSQEKLMILGPSIR